jgi:hypothetical protein
VQATDVVFRLQVVDRLDAIQRSGECQKDELYSLRLRVEALRASIDGGANIGANLLDDVRALLDRSDAALGSVIQRTILGALRYEKIYDRAEEVEEAHSSTFHWLLDEPAPSDQGLEENDSSSSVDAYQDSLAAPEHHEELTQKARESLISWLLKGSGIFHISRKPGAGKSTLMKYLSAHQRTRQYLSAWADGKQLVIANFFF